MDLEITKYYLKFVVEKFSYNQFKKVFFLEVMYYFSFTDGEVYYANHNSKITQWTHPR